MSPNSRSLRDPVETRVDRRTVGDFASAGILSCTADAPLEEVAALMADNAVHAIVVVTDGHEEPPVISDLDLVAALASGHFSELRAADIAGTEAVSVPFDVPLGHAASLLADHRISHLVVRDEHGQPTGIVSTLDLAAAITGVGPADG